MTTDEFSNFMAHFQAAFPDVSAKVLAAGSGTLSAWKSALDQLDFHDAKDAVSALVRGDESLPFNWSEIPALVRKIALRSTRSRIAQQPAQPLPVERGGHSIIAMYGCFRKCVEAGMSDSEAREEMNRQFPFDERKMFRYRCLDCFDSGLVEVWHRMSIDCVVRGDEIIRVYRASVLCKCKSGHHRQADPKDDRPQPPRYDIADYCPWGKGKIEDLKAWVAHRKETRVERMVGYEPAFSEYSNE